MPRLCLPDPLPHYASAVRHAYGVSDVQAPLDPLAVIGPNSLVSHP
jgi:hypothetical protein